MNHRHLFKAFEFYSSAKDFAVESNPTLLKMERAVSFDTLYFDYCKRLKMGANIC